MNKGTAISAAGAVYLQKAISVYQFEALAFLKIDKSNIQESLRLGIK